MKEEINAVVGYLQRERPKVTFQDNIEAIIQDLLEKSNLVSSVEQLSYKESQLIRAVILEIARQLQDAVTAHDKERGKTRRVLDLVESIDKFYESI